MKKFIILSCTLFFAIFGFGQKQVNKFNLLDNKGRKNGFWVEVEKGYKREAYYLNGVKNGIEKVYYRNGDLMAFTEYKMNQPVNLSYNFHEDGYLTFSIKHLGMVKKDGVEMQKGFFTIYFPNGDVKESGIGLYKEGDEELAEEIRIGEWKKFTSPAVSH